MDDDIALDADLIASVMSDDVSPDVICLVGESNEEPSVRDIATPFTQKRSGRSASPL